MYIGLYKILKPLLHDQIFFVKFHVSKAFWRRVDKFTFKAHLTHEIWQRKFGRVKGALTAQGAWQGHRRIATAGEIFPVASWREVPSKKY